MGLRHLVVSVASAGLVLVLAAGVASVRSQPLPAAEPELATQMGGLQLHTHKLMLSIAAENLPLAEFYLHEVHEVAEQLEVLFPEHDGVPVAALVEALLVPRLTAHENALEGGRWESVRSELGQLVDACNACHAAADHGFIRVELTTENPFSQSFAN
jgi:hypothetical protein